jgi:lantibiotic biosynthesis protein
VDASGGAAGEGELAVRVSDWTAVLTGARLDAALRAADHVGRAIADRARVRHAAMQAAEQTAYPLSVRWLEHDVAQGSAGLALACAYFDRCFPGAGWDLVAHDHLASAARSVEGAHVPPSLFSGLAGLAFVTAQLSRDGERYARLTATIGVELAAQTHKLAQIVQQRRDGLAVREFDTISGLAGIAAHLLTRSDAAADAAAQHALEALVGLVCEPGPESRTPRWFTPPELFPHEEEARRYPSGSLNCGLAHGLPGPLAALALALSQGAEVVGLRDAVEQASQWLVSHRCDDRWGVNWPTMVTLPEAGPGADAPSRAAWCYGAPGLARALWLAGTALGEDGLCALAVEAMERVYDRPVAARQIESPTFCHGVAGLLQVTLRFHHDTGLAVFADAAADLVDELLDAFEPDGSLLGFRNVEPSGGRIDQPGLLDGAPGVALALLAASMPVEPTWDRLFLLA